MVEYVVGDEPLVTYINKQIPNYFFSHFLLIWFSFFEFDLKYLQVNSRLDKIN